MAADATEKTNDSVGLTSVVANAGVATEQVREKGMASSAPIAATNFMGTIHTVSPMIPLFAERKQGQIVIMSSATAFLTGLPCFTSYGASKAAQRHYGEALRGWSQVCSHLDDVEPSVSPATAAC